MIIMARKHVRRLTGSPSAPGGGNRRRGEVIMTVPQSLMSLTPSVPDVLMSVIMTQAETPVEETVMADGMRGNGGARGGKM